MIKVLVALSALAVTAAPAAAAPPPDVSNAGQYSNQTLYGDPESTTTVAPPAGYTLNYLQTVGRHGARSLTSADPEQRALALWTSASSRGQLTRTGQEFKADLLAFQKAEKSIGYGNLSEIGATEWKGIGRRTATTYGAFFDKIAASRAPVVFKTTTVRRTQDSAEAMKSGLRTDRPGLNLDTDRVDTSMLIESGSTTQGRAAMARALSTDALKSKARHLLGTLYTPSFVQGIKDPVAAALDIYLLYCTAPGMAGESDVTFAEYVPAADRPGLAQAKDTQNFYRYGPGVKGERSSFKQADPVLADFWARIDARLKGGSVPAVFRLAHGETTMPFAARIKAPGSQTQMPSSTAYRYALNPWRGYVAGRLSGNIEWAMYRGPYKPILITMRYNERPAKFGSACKAADASGYYYRLTELKRCLK